MALSLRGRLLVAHAVLIGAALAIMTVLATREQHRWLIDRQEAGLERVVLRVRSGVANRLATDPKRAPQIADSLSRVLECRVTLMDASGWVRGDSDVPAPRLGEVENHAGRPEMRAALAGRIGRAVRRSRTVGRELIYVAAPLPRGEPMAVLRLAEPLAWVDVLNASLLRVSIVAAAIALFLSVPLVFGVVSVQARRVRELGRVAMRLGAGESGLRALERPDDELGRLGHTINTLASLLRLRMRALERERDERERILMHMSDGVAMIDREDRVMHANQSLAAILSSPLPPPPGTPFQEFARIPELVDLLAQARHSPQPVELDLRLWTPQQRRLRATATHMHGEGDGSVILVLHDLTEVELLNQVRQDFVANVSHELKTPLTSVRGYAETLLDGGLDDPEHRDGFVRIIRDQSTRLEALVDDLLSLAQLERPDARLKGESFDLREAVAQQVAAFQPRAGTARLVLRLEPGPPELVVADRARLDQVIANLLDNALKYTERGVVRVRLQGSAAVVRCEVADTGLGIPEADQPRVFERFYRVDKARSREKGGTGLGLAIVKHIVLLHGGNVGVVSRPGAGSTFHFEIPRQTTP